MPAHGTSEVPAHGTPNQKSSSEVFNENPPLPPTGENGRPPTPKMEISREVIKQLVESKGSPWLKSYLEANNYPLYLLDELDEESKVPEVGQESKAEPEGEKRT